MTPTLPFKEHGSVPESSTGYPRVYKMVGHRIVSLSGPLAVVVCGGILFSLLDNMLAAIPIVLFALFSGYFLMAHLSTQVTLYSDRIVVKSLRGERLMHKDEIERVDIRSYWRGAKIAFLIPKNKSEEDLALPSNSMAFDSKMHEWVASIIGDDKYILEEYRETYKPKWHGFRMPD